LRIVTDERRAALIFGFLRLGGRPLPTVNTEFGRNLFTNLHLSAYSVP
jgi:hypothetical protein